MLSTTDSAATYVLNICKRKDSSAEELRLGSIFAYEIIQMRSQGNIHVLHDALAQKPDQKLNY